MTDIAIRGADLSKRYAIGERARYVTLRDMLANVVKAPASWLGMQAANGHSREHIWALHDVSFEIRAGEVVGLIGSNGAGKTTLLKILARVTRPTSGYAEVYGRMGTLLEVGTGFHPELTGRENVFLSGAILGMTKREIARKFDAMVDFSGVEKFIDTPLKHYSTGMQMRLAFSVAAHLEPEILLVDEVLAVGDAAFQKKCLGKMGEVAGQGRTIVFVSHNMAALLHLCSRALLLERGRVVKDASASETVRHYMESLQTAPHGELSSCDGREGQGRVRFLKAWFEDDQGNAVEHGMSGKPLVIAVSYESRSKDQLRNCRVSVAIENVFGQPLFVCSTEMASDRPQDLNPVGTIRCIIPDLPLSQGRYPLTLFLEVNQEIEDYLVSAVSLTVLDGNFFGSGRQYPAGWQGKCVLVPHRWEAV